jgi:hypothetical protein
MRTLLIYTLAAVLLACFAPLWASAAPAGRIEVSFLYLEPGGSVDPTYHTAMWIEDAKGKMVQTLFVSNELSTTYYETGKACPDWVKQAGWAKAPRSLINAVTGPTPNVSEGTMSFDLGKPGIEPGKYKFRLEVNIDEKYNVLFQGDFEIGNSEQELKMETLYLPSKPETGTDVVKNVKAHYFPIAK